MPRNKMEQEFAEKLSQREIQPANAAWDRLDAMLTATESKQPKRNFKWLYIAAGFLGFLFIGTMFFRQGQSVKIQNNQVATGAPVKSKSPSPAILESPPNEVSEVSIADATDFKVEAAKTRIPENRNVARKRQPTERYLASNDVVLEQSPSEMPTAIIDQKTQPAVTRTLPNSSDALLLEAQARRDANKAKIRVNAKSLLSEVDSESESKLTLKQKAVRALNKNYQHIKVAVENRNVDENH